MKILLIVPLLIFSALQTPAQSPKPNLPNGAVVIETRQLPNSSHPNRLLLLWMLNPTKHPNGYASDEIYTCPDYSRGSYYSGRTSVSLINSATGAIINTVEIAEAGAETFDLPYAIRKGYYYHAAEVTKPGVETKPTIMRLLDYNGDGAPLEFALFNAQACMGLDTTLIGYSAKQDRVIQYPIQLRSISGSKSSSSTAVWADYLFNKKPKPPGVWAYEVDYRGRGGSLDKWAIRYHRLKEQFEGTVVHIPGEDQ